jgi:hypothetical protein
MTAEVLAVVVGIVLSLALEWFPKAKEWYDKYTEGQKKLIAVGLGFVVVAIAFVIGCLDLPASYWACTTEGGWEALRVFALYVVSNQTTYALGPRKK